MSGWATRRLVLAAAAAAAPKPTPSLRPVVAGGDASAAAAAAAAAWRCVRPRVGGTAGVVGLGRGAAAFQTRRWFHGSLAASSALWPVSSVSTSSVSRSRSRSLSSSSSGPSWSSSHRIGIRRYVFSFFSILFLSHIIHHSIHSMPNVIHPSIRQSARQTPRCCPASCHLPPHPCPHQTFAAAFFCLHLIGSSRRYILPSKSFTLVG